jgi:hypothetical protein
MKNHHPYSFHQGRINYHEPSSNTQKGRLHSILGNNRHHCRPKTLPRIPQPLQKPTQSSIMRGCYSNTRIRIPHVPPKRQNNVLISCKCDYCTLLLLHTTVKCLFVVFVWETLCPSSSCRPMSNSHSTFCSHIWFAFMIVPFEHTHTHTAFILGHRKLPRRPFNMP